MNGETSFLEVMAHMVGMVLLVAVPVVVCVLNVLALKRRSTNRFCALAIVILAAAWLGGMVGASMIRSLPGSSSLRAIPFVVCGLLAVLSLVLAIIGLVECARHSHRYRRGQRRAMVAIGFDVLIVGLVAYGLLSGFHQRGFLVPLGTPHTVSAAALLAE